MIPTSMDDTPVVSLLWYMKYELTSPITMMHSCNILPWMKKVVTSNLQGWEPKTNTKMESGSLSIVQCSGIKTDRRQIRQFNARIWKKKKSLSSLPTDKIDSALGALNNYKVGSTKNIVHPRTKLPLPSELKEYLLNIKIELRTPKKCVEKVQWIRWYTFNHTKVYWTLQFTYVRCDDNHHNWVRT